MAASQLIITDEVIRRAEMVLARSPELAAVLPSPDDLAFVERAESSAACFAAACERYAERVAFVSVDGVITYAAVWQRVQALANGLVRDKLLAPGARIGICMPPGVDWVVADLACLVVGAVSVPLAINLPPDELCALSTHARLTVIIAGADQLTLLGRSFENARAQPTVVVTRDLAAIEAAGASAPSIALPPADSNRLITVMYTSGSTGRPKGVMLPERRWRAQLRTALSWPPVPFVMIGYMPLSSNAGRRLVLEVMMQGGRTHFIAQTLPFDDAPLVRPTLMPCLPQLSAMIYQRFQNEVATRLRGAVDPDNAMDDPRGREIAAELGRTLLGDRLCLIRIGAAATAPHLIDFVARSFAVPIADGYGLTETGSLTLNDKVFPHVEYRLVAVPELGYSPDDRPHPRGELLVRSPELALGYLDDPEATAASFDADGFFLTGDIVEERAPRELRVIDRRSSVIKLANAQFVAPSQLEQLYVAASTLIEQVYLYANPRYAYLLAVLVPTAEALAAHADEAALRHKLREELDRIARAAGRRTHEIPRDFLIEREPFTQRNTLLTDSGKQAVRRLREHYGPRLDALQVAIEARQRVGTETVAGDSVAKLRALLAIALGLTTDEVATAAADVSFSGFGGDSISAMRFCSLASEQLGIEVSIGSVLDPSTSVASLVERLVARLERPRSAPSYAEIHGDGDEVHAADVERLVPAAVSPSGAPAVRPPRTILLTGATGFLGRFLLDELVARCPSDGRVVCLVRGDRDDIARARLCSQLAAGGGALADRIERAVSEGRIEVRAGDLSAPELGLSRADYEALCARIDAVVHNGALVNHAMSYRHLFEPNVLGTLEVARLALRRPDVALHFVSSIAVAARTTATVAETATARELWRSRRIGGGEHDHAVGYATSKWAAEVVLENVHERYGVPVKIYRCSNLAPHREHAEHLNWADNTNRLLYSIVATRTAPDSFYRGQATRYDLVPVDVVAASIAASAWAGARGFSIRHVSSVELEPMVSLDTIVGWLEASGIALRRLPYSAWVTELRSGLEALPADRRARSALITIGRWSHPIEPAGRPAIDTSLYRREVRELLDRELRPIDEALVARWARAIGHMETTR